MEDVGPSEMPPFWVLLVASIAALLAVTELGHRLGGRRSRSDSRAAIAGVSSAALAALLGLLGLLLGFSFSIVESRYAARRRLILDEANAIGTAYLRAAMLPPPHEQNVRELLRAYVDTRTPTTLEDVSSSIARSETIHRELWRETVAAARLDPRSQPTALFIDSLNTVIDRHEERVVVSLHQRLPRPILLTLLAVAMLGMGVLGYGAGVAGVRAATPTLALTVAISVVTSVIIELDRPGGLFRLSQTAMIDTREMMLEREALDRASAE